MLRLSTSTGRVTYRFLDRKTQRCCRSLIDDESTGTAVKYRGLTATVQRYINRDKVVAELEGNAGGLAGRV